MEQTVVSVSVSKSAKESVEKIRGMFQEIPQLCLSFESSVELAEFLRAVMAASYAFEKRVEEEKGK